MKSNSADQFPLSKVDPSKLAMEIRTTVVMPVIRYLRDNHGSDVLRQFINDSGMNLGYLLNANNWISFDYLCSLFDRLVVFTGNPNIAYEISLRYTDQQSYGPIGSLVTRVVDPGLLYREIGRINRLWNRISHWEVRDFTRNSCRIAVRYPHHQQRPNNCLAIRGGLCAFPIAFGLPRAEVEEVQCVCRGDDQCVFKVHWVGRPSLYWGSIGWVAGFLVGILPAWMAGWGMSGVAIWMTSSFFGFFIGRLADYHVRLAEVYRKNENQAAALNTVISEMEQLNQDLGKRVEERTAELEKTNTELIRQVQERERMALELRHEKEVAETANRMKTQFLANMSHEMRTPLNSIIGFSEIIQKEQRLPTIRHYNRTVLNESVMLLAIINDLLDHAKIEAGRMELEHKPFSLRRMLSRLENSYGKQARDKGLDFRLAIDPNVPDVLLGDVFRLYQILLNLTGNAVKFTATGSVSVEAAAREFTPPFVRLLLAVTDTGPGIAAEKHAQIFHSFTQADGSTTRRYGGTGLGLTISSKLAELMGGELRVESEPGKGSRFICEIPIAVAGADIAPEDMADLNEEVAESVTEAIQDKQAQVLVVEDYEPNQELMRFHLGNTGCQVDSALNGKEAIERCRAKAYHLILMDIQMPEMDGLQAVRLIRDTDNPCRSVPVIALTADADMRTRKHCLEAGMNDVMTKPVRRRILLETVERWLRPEANEGLSALVFTGECDIEDGKREGEPCVLDMERAIEEFCGDRPLFMRLLTRFIEESPAGLSRLRDGLDSPNPAEMVKIAHRLRGGAANLGADSFAWAAGEVERAAASGATRDLPQQIDRLEKAFAELRKFVKQYDHENIDCR